MWASQCLLVCNGYNNDTEDDEGVVPGVLPLHDDEPGVHDVLRVLHQPDALPTGVRRGLHDPDGLQGELVKTRTKNR